MKGLHFCKDKGFRKFEFVTKTQFNYLVNYIFIIKTLSSSLYICLTGEVMIKNMRFNFTLV